MHHLVIKEYFRYEPTSDWIFSLTAPFLFNLPKLLTQPDSHSARDGRICPQFKFKRKQPTLFHCTLNQLEGGEGMEMEMEGGGAI